MIKHFENTDLGKIKGQESPWKDADGKTMDGQGFINRLELMQATAGSILNLFSYSPSRKYVTDSGRIVEDDKEPVPDPKLLKSAEVVVAKEQLDKAKTIFIQARAEKRPDICPCQRMTRTRRYPHDLI